MVELLPAEALKAREEALDVLISKSEIDALTYIYSSFLISNKKRIEKGGAVADTLLLSRREIGNILRSDTRWAVWSKIFELKATSVPELSEFILDDQTAWRVIKPLVKIGILREVNELAHPHGRGNKIPIFSLVDADPEFSVDASARARRIVGERSNRFHDGTSLPKLNEELNTEEASVILAEYKRVTSGYPLKFVGFRNWLTSTKGMEFSTAKAYAEAMLKAGSVTI